MKKIPCLFQRNFSDPRAPKILDEVTPGCEWVLAGEGVATYKHDGTSCLVRGGKLFKRYDAKRGKAPPPGFEPAQDPDPITGHHPGWVPVDVNNPDPADVWHALAWHMRAVSGYPLADWTYELCGPRINSNRDRLTRYVFFRHGGMGMDYSPRTFEQLRIVLAARPVEGLVFWRNLDDPDCDKAKITRENFGLSWPW